MSAIKETVKNNRIIRHLYYFSCGIFLKKQLVAKAYKTLADFGIDTSDPDKAKLLVQDMVKMYSLYGFTAEEYLYNHFAEKNMEERLHFVADWEHLGYTCAMNNPRNAELFDNKWRTYQKFKEYYGRDVLQCEGIADKERFQFFAATHTKFIVKALNLSCGKGIQIVAQTNQETSSALYERLMSEYNGCFLVEELIEQTPEMAKFHPSSVNTLRMPTVRLDDETLIMHPFMRIGQHGNHVDNAGAGGLICVVDVDTGTIYSAADEKGKFFEVHPDSNENIVGFRVPCWEEAKAFVKELADVLPDNRYTGWDIALTSDGWKMVEANRRGQFVWQIPMGSGFRDEINGILRRMGKKY